MSSLTQSTEELLHHARRDPAGRGALLQHYANYLRVLATTQLDRRLQARVGASDVVQETLLEAHRDFAQFRGTGTAEFLAWLRQILVHNLAREVDCHVVAGKRDVRRERAFERLNDSIEGSAAGLAQLIPDEQASPSRVAMRQEELLALADALTELSPEYRHVIRLRHLEGMPFREVAERLQRSEGAVRMLWFRAMVELRKILGERGVL